MATIIVRRGHAFTAAAATVRLRLNGVEQGKIKSGSTVAIDAPEGTHELRAHHHWYASNPLPIVLRDPGDKVVVELTTSENPDEPADMGILRSLIHPRSAFSLRLID